MHSLPARPYPPVAAAADRHSCRARTVLACPQAYQPLLAKLAAVYDVMLYGTPKRLEMEEIHAPKRTEFSSGLVEMANQADGNDDVDIELYW